MAHPKRRQSKHRQGIRCSQIGVKPPQINHCARCTAPIKPHTVCDNCGYYGFGRGGEKRGREVLVKEDF